MKQKIAKKIKRKKRIKPFSIDEDIERFFPKVSHMGIPNPSQWEHLKLIATDKSVKVPL